MATYTKTILSGSTSGMGIKIVPTATLGTTIHTAHATSIDEIWLYAVNSDTTARKLTIEYGGAATPDRLIEQTIQPEAGLVLVVPGFVLTGGLVVTAFCATANVVMIYGFVNRVS